MEGVLTYTQMFALDLLKRHRVMAIGSSNSSSRMTIASSTADVLVRRGVAQIVDARIVLVEQA